MSKSIPNVKFELHKVYKTYADQLELSGGIADIILDNSNIPAAGGQVEGSLRILLANLLPERVTVSHGHIVDKNGAISYQQDVLIADSFNSRSLIKTLDGTEFYPYESIFLTGEIKKRWSTKNLKGTIKSIKHNKEILERHLIPPNVLDTTSKIILPHQLTKNAFRNPLFTFSFSLNKDPLYSSSAITKIYNDRREWKNLPNISVILDSGIYILLDKLALQEGKLKIKLYPEFSITDENCQWYFLRLEPEESLAYLVFILIQHINDTILETPSALLYSESMLNVSFGNISSIDDL